MFEFGSQVDLGKISQRVDAINHKGLNVLLHVWRSQSIPDQLSVHSVAATATGSIHLIKMKAELLRL